MITHAFKVEVNVPFAIWTKVRLSNEYHHDVIKAYGNSTDYERYLGDTSDLYAVFDNESDALECEERLNQVVNKYQRKLRR